MRAAWVSLGAAALALGAGCRLVLGLDETKPLLTASSVTGASVASSTAGVGGGGGDTASAGGAGGATSGGGGAGGGALYNTDWASWPVPADSPAATDYTTDKETVVDKVTGLVWQRKVGADVLGQSIVAACKKLTLGGFDDWRPPSLVELITLLDYGANGPQIELSAFPGSFPDLYWTTTITLGDDTHRETVGFGQNGQIQFTNVDLSPYPVRCVRGGKGIVGPHYSLASGVVRDNGTGLIWAADASDVMTRQTAAQKCQGASVGPYASGWRLPSLKELWTLYDQTHVPGPFWDESAFGAGADLALHAVFLSSDPFLGIDFKDLPIAIVDEAKLNHVRCVHEASP